MAMIFKNGGTETRLVGVYGSPKGTVKMSQIWYGRDIPVMSVFEPEDTGAGIIGGDFCLTLIA